MRKRAMLLCIVELGKIPGLGLGFYLANHSVHDTKIHKDG